MARRGPSLTALLGMLALAGYQNRSKISEMLNDAKHNVSKPAQGSSHGSTNFLSDITDRFSSSKAGSTVSSALSELRDSFQGTGNEAAADSWISNDDSQRVDDEQLENAIGAETLDHLSEQTGLSRSELLSRLSTSLPDTVNRFTPEGRLPTEDEGSQYL